MKTIAGTALLAALDEGIAVPSDVVYGVWSWLRGAPSVYFNAEKLAEVADEKVRAEAVEILRELDSGTTQRQLALQVLSNNVQGRHVTDEGLLDLVERVRVGSHAIDLADLIVTIDKARGVPLELLIAIRNRWSCGSISVKEAAIKLAGALPELDLTWTRQLLEDPEPDVRACLVYQLERDARSGEGLITLLEKRLGVEPSPDVRAAIHHALASMQDVEDGRERRKRRRLLRQQAT